MAGAWMFVRQTENDGWWKREDFGFRNGEKREDDGRHQRSKDLTVLDLIAVQ